MAIISQPSLFSWEQIDDLGDLERLRLVLDYMPDERLMRALEGIRGHGQNTYAIRAVWNSVLAGIVYEHKSVESLRRELQRNGQLRQLCGFEPLLGAKAVPTARAYTSFLKNLMRRQVLLDGILDQLVESLRETLKDFGRHLAADGKAIDSLADGKKKGEQAVKPDGRRDNDANWGTKTYSGQHKDGTLWKKVKHWFGFKLHLIVDAVYELPVAYEVTCASRGEQPVARQLVDRLNEHHPEVLEMCDDFAGDKGYDDTVLIKTLWDDYGIKALIPARDLWKKDAAEGTDGTRRVTGTENVVYTEQAEVSCLCLETGEKRPMAYGGFEKDRETLKFRCPARHYGIECAGAASCPVNSAVRIPLSEDRRVFTPLPRSSYAWKRAYKRRTAVERVNSRIAGPFGFDQHFIRGLNKMKMRCGLALIVMLAMALGRVKENQAEHLRSLVKAV